LGYGRGAFQQLAHSTANHRSVTEQSTEMPPSSTSGSALSATCGLPPRVGRYCWGTSDEEALPSVLKMWWIDRARSPGSIFLFSDRTKLADRRCRRCRFASFPARLSGPPVPRWVHGRVGAAAAHAEHTQLVTAMLKTAWNDKIAGPPEPHRPRATAYDRWQSQAALLGTGREHRQPSAVHRH
jgi:hypothetical protein